MQQLPLFELRYFDRDWNEDEELRVEDATSDDILADVRSWLQARDLLATQVDTTWHVAAPIVELSIRLQSEARLPSNVIRGRK